MNKRSILKIVLLVLVTRIGFLWLRQIRGYWWLADVDGYVAYARALVEGTIHTGGVREYIFPGFSFIISLFRVFVSDWSLAALVAVLVSSVLGFLAIGYLFSLPVVAISVVFPPAFLWATSRIYSEGLMLALLYGSLWLWKRNNLMLAWLTAGLSMLVRPIGLTLLVALFLISMRKKVDVKAANGLFLGLIPTSLLLIFNTIFWGDALHNLGSYRVGQTGLVPFLSFFENFLRLVRDQGWRTLVSGGFYIFLATAGMVVLAKLRNRSEFHLLVFFWAVAQWLFLFTIGPAAFFEDFGRYASFLYPIAFWGFLQLRIVGIPRWVYPCLWLAAVLFRNT